MSFGASEYPFEMSSCLLRVECEAFMGVDGSVRWPPAHGRHVRAEVLMVALLPLLLLEGELLHLRTARVLCRLVHRCQKQMQVPLAFRRLERHVKCKNAAFRRFERRFKVRTAV